MVPMVMTSMSVPTALAAGVSAVRIMEKTNVGRVMPLPMVKKVMMKSSRESDMAMSAAPTTVGRMIGKRDRQEGPQRRGAEIARALDDAKVEIAQPGIDDEHDERQREQQMAHDDRLRAHGNIGARVEAEQRHAQHQRRQHERQAEQCGGELCAPRIEPCQTEGGHGADDGGQRSPTVPLMIRLFQYAGAKFGLASMADHQRSDSASIGNAD